MFEGAGIFKTVGLVFLVGFLIVWVLGIVSASVHLLKTGDSLPLINVVGGRILGIDQRLSQDVDLLLQKDKILGEKRDFFSQNTFSLIKDDVLFNIGFFVIIFYFLYKFGAWISGNAQFDPMTKFVIFLLIFSFFAVGEILYSYFITGEFVIPLQGVFKVFRHFDVIMGIPNVSFVTNVGFNASTFSNLTNVTVIG